MKGASLKNLSALGIMGLFASICVADPQIRFKINVKLDDDDAKAAYSYLTREARALGDVQIVDSDPDIILDVLTLTARSGARSLGYVVGAVLMYPDVLHSEKNIELTHFLRIAGNSDGFKETCQTLISEIDTDYFSILRKAKAPPPKKSQ